MLEEFINWDPSLTDFHIKPTVKHIASAVNTQRKKCYFIGCQTRNYMTALALLYLTSALAFIVLTANICIIPHVH
jgi:hypothetical protein